MRIIYILVFLFTIISCQSKSSRNKKISSKNTIQQIENVSPENNISNEIYYVYKVIDGDTFYCYDINNNEIKIRLIGIDTPETRNRFKKKKGYYGEEAKQYLTHLILNKQVKLEFDIDKYDQYQRFLAYAYTMDEQFINAELVKNGYARIMTIQPNSKYANLFYDLQLKARADKKGLWAVEEY